MTQSTNHKNASQTTHRSSEGQNKAHEGHQGQHGHSHQAAQNQQNNAHGGKDPARVEAGKKAAETRGHASLSQAGKKGGEHSHNNH